MICCRRGISAGILVLFYAVYSLYKYQREAALSLAVDIGRSCCCKANRIISLFEANTQIKEKSDDALSHFQSELDMVQALNRAGLQKV